MQPLGISPGNTGVCPFDSMRCGVFSVSSRTSAETLPYMGSASAAYPRKGGVPSTFFPLAVRIRYGFPLGFVIQFLLPPLFSWAFCRFSGSDQRGGSMFSGWFPGIHERRRRGFGCMIRQAWRLVPASRRRHLGFLPATVRQHEK